MVHNLDQTLFIKALHTKLGNENLQITEIRNQSISSKAEHGLSDIFKVYLRYKDVKKGKEKITSVIVKKEPASDGPRLDLIRKQGIFATEVNFLWSVLPNLDKQLGCSFGPRIFYSNKNSNLFIMEDLHAKGFRLQDRQKGLSMSHALMTIDRIAKFHAASVALFEKKPEIMRSFKSGIMSNETHANMYKFVKSSLLIMTNSIIENWTDQEAIKGAHKLKNMADDFENRIKKVYNYDEDEFCVLNHGDFWHSNLLFKHNKEGLLVDMRMIDFQMCVFTSPVIDLLYFLGICTENDIKCDMDDYLLNIYLQTLKKTMKKINCKTKAPTMDHLKKAIYKRKIYAIFSSLILYPRMIADEEDVETFDEFLITGKTKLDVFKNPDAISAVRKTIKYMNERGYMD